MDGRISRFAAYRRRAAVLRAAAATLQSPGARANTLKVAEMWEYLAGLAERYGYTKTGKQK